MTITLADLSLEDRRSLPHNHPLLDAHAEAEEKRLGLPPGLIRAIKNAGERSESLGGPGVSISPKGATGVMQLMPTTQKDLGVKDPTDPLEAISGGGQYLVNLKKQLGTEDPRLLAAAYNAGPNRTALREGRIPEIPETQKYVQLVHDYLGKMPKPVAPQPPAPSPAAPPPVPGGISIDDLTPEDKARLMKAHGIGPTSGMTNSELAWAGAGKQVADMGRGLGQLAANYVINPAAKLFGAKSDVFDPGYATEAETRARDAELMSTGPGLGGYMGAAVATSALPGGALAKSAMAGKATTALATAVPALAKVAPIIAPAAITGGALSAMAPATSEGERAGNAVFGALTSPLFALAGAGAAKGVGWVADKTGITEALKNINVPPFLKPSWNDTLKPSDKAVVDRALAHDVPVYGSQLEKPGSALTVGRAAKQREALDRAIVRTMGEDTDDVVAAFANAERRIGGEYQRILTGKTIPLGQAHLNDLKALSQYNSSRAPRFPASRELDDAIQRADAAARLGPITGEEYQRALSQYKGIITQLSKSTPERPADYHAAEGFRRLIDSLTKQAEKVLSGEELSAFKTANRQWRNMSTLESLAPRTADGNINPKQLANVLARKDKGAFIYGKGDTTLSDLARYGSTHMGLDSTAPKGLLQQGKEFARHSAPVLAGDVAGAYLIGSQMGGHGEGTPTSDLLKYLALGTGVHLGLTGARNAMNPRLTAADMKAPRGALGSWWTATQPGAAAANTEIQRRRAEALWEE